jgi:hypothetical protein
MGYLGYKPADKPLTAADITDSIITSAKIVDGTIVNGDISTTSAITLNKISGNPSFRNIVINGDMQIAQRSTSVASITTNGYRTLDRFETIVSSLGTWTQSKSTDVPTGKGFASSLKMDCTTAEASLSGDKYLAIRQKFEGQNLQYLKKGTADAVSLTASFWVKSTKTGTFIVNLVDSNNFRQISKSYTVSVSNTWEFKTVTFDGDTTGAFTNDNGISLILSFWLAAGTNYTSGTLATSWATYADANSAVGQVNIADSTSNDFFITGIQLEAGTSATDFEFLPYDVDLLRCQRYFIQYGDNAITKQITTFGSAVSTVEVDAVILFPYEMRAVPTISSTNIRASDNGGGNLAMSSVTIASSSTTKTALIYGTVTGATQYRPYTIMTSTSAGYIHLSSEL